MAVLLDIQKCDSYRYAEVRLLWYNDAQVTVVDLVAKLRADQHRGDVIARIVGYVVMIQRLGWEELPLNRIAKYNLKKTFRLLNIDPLQIEI